MLLCLAGAWGAEGDTVGDSGSPPAESITVGWDTVLSPACDSWVPTDQTKPNVLGWQRQLSCPGSITLPDVRLEDLYVFWVHFYSWHL